MFYISTFIKTYFFIAGSPREAKGKKKGRKHEKGKGKKKKKKPLDVVEEPTTVEEDEYVYVPVSSL